jgi:threonyl-tRNA synthetase
LEREHLRAKQGEKPMLPFWLAPTQIRLLPVTTAHQDAAAALKMKVLAKVGRRVRIEIDDREEGIGRKIRDAEKDWVPLIIVLGDKEASTGTFTPRVRRPDLLNDAGLAPGTEEFNDATLAAMVTKLLEGKPTADLAVPERLSLQPVFRG